MVSEKCRSAAGGFRRELQPYVLDVRLLPGGVCAKVSFVSQAAAATPREAALQALSRAGNERTVATRLLGVSRRTPYNELDERGIP